MFPFFFYLPNNSTNNRTRVPPPRLLCHRNHSPPAYSAISLSARHRFLPPAYLPLGGENTPYLCHGFCQSSQTGSSTIFLVLRVQGQLCARRHLWLAFMGHRTRERRSRVLQDALGRVPLDPYGE